MKKAFLLLNGEPPNIFPEMDQYNCIAATDGAYLQLKKAKILPTWISGDFDSLSTLPKNIQTFHTPDQNFTDFEKALNILLEQGYHDIEIFGASGKEQDHFLGNMHTAKSYQNKARLTFFDNYCKYFFIKKAVTLQNVLNRTISLFPFPTANKVNSNGLQYELNQHDFELGKLIGTRNKAVKDEVKISHEAGDLILFISY